MSHPGWIERLARRLRRRPTRRLADLPPYGLFQINERLKIIYGEDPVPPCLLEKFRFILTRLKTEHQEVYLCNVVEKDAVRSRDKRNLDAYLSRRQRAHELELQAQETLERQEQRTLLTCLDMEATSGELPSADALAREARVENLDAARCIRALQAPVANPTYYHALFEAVPEYKDIISGIRACFPEPSLEILIRHGFDTRLAKGIASYLVSKGIVKAVPRVNLRSIDASRPVASYKRVLAQPVPDTKTVPVQDAMNDAKLVDHPSPSLDPLEILSPRDHELIMTIDKEFFHWEW